MDDEKNKKIIAYYDFVPMHVLAKYLKIKPKEVYKIYSDLIDTGERTLYKKAAQKELDLQTLTTRLRRLTYLTGGLGEDDS